MQEIDTPLGKRLAPDDNAQLDARLLKVETTVTECKLALAAQSMKLAELITTVNTLIREVNKHG